jgi:predicted O-methyltransferase YrrM
MSTPTAFRPGEFVAPAVESYLRDLQWHPDELLAQMRAHGERDGIPLVSDQTGLLLELLVRLARPHHIVEFGTAIGYSTVFMARALQTGATLTSYEIDPERHRQASEYLGRCGATATVRIELGDARELVQRLDGSVDMAFLDATKGEYRTYLEAVLDRMPAGGLVVVDNALMSGTVATGESDGHWKQDSIESQRAFNEALIDDDRLVSAQVLPIGDGVALAIRA